MEWEGPYVRPGDSNSKLSGRRSRPSWIGRATTGQSCARLLSYGQGGAPLTPTTKVQWGGVGVSGRLRDGMVWSHLDVVVARDAPALTHVVSLQPARVTPALPASVHPVLRSLLS